MVSVFILSYNNPQMLLKCIESCLMQPEIDEYLILDNFSTDFMGDAYVLIRNRVESFGKVFKLRYEQEPISFSAGQNWGLGMAKNDIVLLLNNDAFFLKENTLRYPLEDLKLDSVGMVGFKILNPDGTMNHFGMVFPPFVFGPIHYARFENPFDIKFSKSKWCYAVTGAAMLVNRCDIRFDPGYWYGSEDVDFCFQFLKAGKKIICNSICLIEHAESTCTQQKQVKDSAWTLQRKGNLPLFRKKWGMFCCFLQFKDLRNTLFDFVVLILYFRQVKKYFLFFYSKLLLLKH